MRHSKAFRKLGRDVAHRRAMLRNLATSLVIHDQIETTLPRAKELKRIADKLVLNSWQTRTLHRRRKQLQVSFAINRKQQSQGRTSDAYSVSSRLFARYCPSS
ncbi:UNVERIFIED_CONTAM: hypothetical protein GTU68_016363 [Idotea baltica]|nr:hypothetical protein [Idotea baltica]